MHGYKKSLSSPRLKLTAQGMAQCANVQSRVKERQLEDDLKRMSKQRERMQMRDFERGTEKGRE